ncbi:amidohydrolase [Fonsecaea pedrosoi]|nr:amidohydrolase [Fonsecaea pedrosoi]
MTRRKPIPLGGSTAHLSQGSGHEINRASSRASEERPEAPSHPIASHASIPSSLSANVSDLSSCSTRLISTSFLIPGRGRPQHNMSVIVQDGTITSIQPTASVPPPFKNLPTTFVPVLIPGLWDCHIHLLGSKTFNFSEIATQSTALAGARIARNVHDILMSGFTSVRELAGYGLEVSKAIEEGTLVGPNIYSSGAAISQTAGHGDVFDLPWGFVGSLFGVRDTQANGLSPGTGPMIIADGIDECRRAVRLLVRRGAKCIKVFASGGVLSIADDPMRQQFSLDELKVIVEEARRAGRVVGAHCHGKDGIMAALHAGVHSIEHGTYMDEECIELMKEQGTVYVPTRTIVKVGVDHPELMSPESYRKMLETAKYHRTAYRLAVQSGVKIVLGTDLGISTPATHPLAHGRSGGELSYAVSDGGMEPLAAIEAATAMGPEVLGSLGMAPKSGRIEVGYDADLIALNVNPLENMDVFKEPKNITHVWKGGRLFKSPSHV